MKFPIGERVRSAREDAGLTQRDLSKLTGISFQAIQAIEAGKVKNPRQIEKLSAALKKTKEYLLHGIDETTYAEKIPIIQWNNIEHYLKMSREQMEKMEEYVLNYGNFGNDCLALRIENDAMCASKISEKTFKRGEVIIFKKDNKPEPNKYVVYSEDGGKTASFKQYITDGARTYLKPLNPHYPIIPLTPNIKIYGVVVAHLDLTL